MYVCTTTARSIHIAMFLSKGHTQTYPKDHTPDPPMKKPWNLPSWRNENHHLNPFPYTCRGGHKKTKAAISWRVWYTFCNTQKRTWRCILPISVQTVSAIRYSLMVVTVSTASKCDYHRYNVHVCQNTYSSSTCVSYQEAMILQRSRAYVCISVT